MTRSITAVFFVAAVAVTSSVAEAQWPYVQIIPGTYGFGGYGGYGFGPYGGFNRFNGGGYGYGSFNYLYPRQALQTQQIFQQQQQAIIDRIQEAQGRLETLNAIKQQKLQKYLSMSDADKAAFERISWSIT